MYVIFHRKSGKVYVGSSSRCVFKRMQGHRKCLRGNYHPNRYLQFAWNKYGSKAFGYQVLEECEPDLCVPREQHWINQYKSYIDKFGYNLSPTAGSLLGLKKTLEQRKEIGDRAKKVWSDEQFRKRMSAMHAERYTDPREREKLLEMNRRASKVLTGRKWTPEQREAQRQRMKAIMSDPEMRDKLKGAWRDGPNRDVRIANLSKARKQNTGPRKRRKGTA